MTTRKVTTLLLQSVAPAVVKAGQCRPLLRASLVSAVLFMFFQASTALAAAVAPPLGTAGTYAVLGTNSVPTSGTVTCTDSGPGTAINGDVGSTFNVITNSGCTITGSI